MLSSDIEVSVFSATSKSAILRWTRVYGASSYKVIAAPQNSPGNPVGYAVFGPHTVMGTINSLSPNIMYTFTVAALDNAQEILNIGTIDSSSAPEVMDPLRTVKSKDSKTFIVSFSLKTGATSYIIRLQNPNRFIRENIVSSSPAEIESLDPYTEYSLSIMSVNSGGQSQPSSPVTAKTATTASLCPGLLLPTLSSTASLYKFAWNTTIITHNTSNTNWIVSGLDMDSVYVIKGFAWDLEGRQGEDSLYIDQMTRPAMSSIANVSMVINNGLAGISVSWERDEGVFGSLQYHVMNDQNLTCNSTSSSCILSPVGCGEVHTVWVSTSDEAGPSDPSGPVSPAPHSLWLLWSRQKEAALLTWDTVTHVNSYTAFIKRGDGAEESCNTTSRSCTYNCTCGHTYLMSVMAFNQAGSSPEGQVLNYTTLPCCPEGVSISAVSTDTFEITWTVSRGAELYQTRAADSSEVILCNDTAPVCALSDLSCDSSYSVVLTPCNDISGCNRACKAHTQITAPCMPMNLMLTQRNSSCFSVSWTLNNRLANYTVTASGDDGTRTCNTDGNSCDITDLPCGSNFEVSVIATSPTGLGLPSYSELLETGPCCPVDQVVDQVTQAMSNVSWSRAKGAHTFITSLTSTRGHARCHTMDSHCLMGCITCGTNYTVTMEAISHSGRRSNCSYEGFSSSACCPSGVRLYGMAHSSLRVHWRGAGSSHSYVTELVGSRNNYTCTASPGESSCDVPNIQCGDVYTVVVAPLTPEGSKVLFCAQRIYSGRIETSLTVVYDDK
ncbi:hypothetical protein KUCAC02_023313 [Chaenocephalus aceratus]|uniref:Uncharacterized protein n=1 Tax=Chaenocephalus aceratus TaxID=36190 RepID=A0ACB9XR71_CHAAC|nr:hypothetical protein KUCAC02_023313 [Chaenocephalus aceratus]